MVRRHERTAFMGGAYVFPGGRVDEGDRHVDARWLEGAVESAAFQIAAARELFEEAGVLVARDARGRFVSLATDDAHRRFKEYRRAVHAGGETLFAILEREKLRSGLEEESK